MLPSESPSSRQSDPVHRNGDFEPPPDPFALFEAWFDRARAEEPNDPDAMALATATPSGAPSVRMVLLRGVDPAGSDPRGFVFYTNLDSRKGGELASNPRASLCFHWKSLRRQVRIEGRVTPVSAAEADAYFAARARGSRIGAWASDQSRPLADRATLECRVAAATARYGATDGDGPVPRPPYWSGFRLDPEHIEFWQERPFRLHDRIVYAASGPGWRIGRLFP
jgi:pyridoxamine 5'-phosphate oxidase